jgi:hypothetical protein
MLVAIVLADATPFMELSMVNTDGSNRLIISVCGLKMGMKESKTDV